MVEEAQQPRRRGRPPKTVAQPKSGSFTFRLRPDMRERLEASAEARGISISEEIESRLELSLDTAFDPFKIAALRMMVEQWKIIDALTGMSLRGADLSIYAETAKRAVDETIRLVSEPALAVKATSESIKNFFGGVVRRELPESGRIVDPSELAEITDNLADGYASGISDAVMMDDIVNGPAPAKKTRAERDEEARAAAARKAAFLQDGGVFLTPEEMAEQFGPPGRRYLRPTRKPKSQT